MLDVKLIDNQKVLNLNFENNEEVLHSLPEESVSSTLSQRLGLESLVYHELDDFPIKTMSEIDRLSDNIKILSGLNSRLSFVMKEVHYMLNIKNK